MRVRFIVNVVEYLDAHGPLGSPDHIAKDFPLVVPTLKQLGLTEHYASYVVSLSEIESFSEQNLILASYRYQKGGSMAYEVTYGGTGYLYSVMIIYEFEAQAACNLQGIKTNLNNFYREDGTYVLTTQGLVVSLTDYVASKCS